MPALFEDIFSLLSFVLAVGIIVFVILGIYTCVLTDCSDLKSYSFKYQRTRAWRNIAFRSNSKTRPVLAEVLIREYYYCECNNNLQKFFASKIYFLQNEKDCFSYFSKFFLFSCGKFHLSQFLIRDLLSSRTVHQPPSVPSPKTGTSTL